MTISSPYLLTIALAALTFLLSTAGPGSTQMAFPLDDWARVLETFVNEEGLVDYARLAEDREHLDGYLARIRITGPRTHPELFPTNADRLAYYLNAYNALVFQGVLALGPSAKSVWGAGTGYKFFVAMDVSLEGFTTNLKKLEDKIIRAGFQDPRIHAALNCASKGCPRLPPYPFAGDSLDETLDEAMKEFVESSKHCLVDREKRTVHLSKIFKWFKDDFTRGHKGDKALIAYVNGYRQTGEPIPETFKVRYLPYDKSLNKQ